MNFVAFLALGFAPGAFWLWLIYQRDRYIPAPAFLVVRTFLWGVAVAVPVVFIELLLATFGGIALGGDPSAQSSDVVHLAYISFVVAGFTEEAAKFLVVRRTVYASPYFRQPLDGIIFGAAAALGFASIENVSYMVAFGPAVILVRGPLTTLAHVFFSVAWGYALGVRKQRKGWPGMAALALLSAMFLHGLFDFLVFLANARYEAWAFILFITTAIIFLWLIRKARRESPFRHKVATVLAACPTCGQQVSFAAHFCTACATPLRHAGMAGPWTCGTCRQPVATNHHFCTSCGSRLDRRSRLRV